MNNSTKNQRSNEVFNILIQMGKDHSELLNNDKPSKIFIDKLKALIQAQSVYVHDATSQHAPSDVRIPFVGYFDHDYYYINSEISYQQVVKFCADQGDFFPIGQRTLMKHLAEDKIIEIVAGNKTPRHVFYGKRGRFLTIKRKLIEDT